MKKDKHITSSHNNANAVVVCRSWSWGRYRFRLSNRHEDVPRDFNSWRLICFKHRVEQSLCHCTESEHHFKVTPKIAIPKKDDIKAWQELEDYLKEFGDHPEHINHNLQVPMKDLTNREKLLYKLFGIKPEVGYSSNVRSKFGRR